MISKSAPSLSSPAASERGRVAGLSGLDRPPYNEELLMTRLFQPIVAMALSILVLVSCSTTPKTADDRADFHSEVMAAIDDFKQKDQTMAELFNAAHGYVVFPNVGKGGLVVGGASGRGEVYEQGTLIGYSRLTQGTVGAQIGGQAYREVIFFENEAALARLRDGEFAFAAQASAVAASEGASADADYQDGVLVFTSPIGGLMAEASIGGQNFSFEAIND
jgi:lipid-binding SYLF domain-containing protein